MPCMINGGVISDATWLAAMNADVSDEVSFETKVNMKIIKFIIACRSVSPTLHATAENYGQEVHRNVDALVTEVSEHLQQVKVDTAQQNTRVNEASTDYESNLMLMRDGTERLNEAATVVVNSREENRGELEHAIETQIDTQSSLALQQSMVQKMQASLAHLPELLLLNREMQALRVENARLSLENEGYASHIEALLSVIREQREENGCIKEQLSGRASQVDTLLALVRDMSSEADERHTHGTQNAGTHFSLNLFS